MQRILNRQQSREVDRLAIEQFAMSGLVLMENAGRGVADRLVELGARGPVLIACGRGNNGGDGFVIARHLDGRGIPVRVACWCAAQDYRGDAAANLEILRRAQFPIEYFDAGPSTEWWSRQADAEWVVDALLGTGSHGAPRAPLDQVIQGLNDLAKPILSVDLPSGLDCDTGATSATTIRATETCTFVAAKRGLIAPAATEFVGRLTVLPIGVPARLLQRL